MDATLVNSFRLNQSLLNHTRHRVGLLAKQAFVPGGDPSMAGDPAAGGGGAAGGAPPGGGDPAAGGGGGGGGGMDPGMLQQMVQQAVQQAMMSQGGGGMGGGMGGAGSGAPLKPKIDVNVELMQIKNILAKIADQLGIQIPAQDMVATPDKLMAMSQGMPTGTAGGGGGDAAGGGAISPLGPVDPAGTPGGGGGGMPGGGMPGKQASYERGRAFSARGTNDMANLASMIRSTLRGRNN